MVRVQVAVVIAAIALGPMAAMANGDSNPGNGYSAGHEQLSNKKGHHNNGHNNGRNWVASWATASKVKSGFDGDLPVFNNTTLRQIVRTSIGGRGLRVWLTNEMGTEPLVVGAATVGLRVANDEIAAGKLRTLSLVARPVSPFPPARALLATRFDCEWLTARI